MRSSSTATVATSTPSHAAIAEERATSGLWGLVSIAATSFWSPRPIRVKMACTLMSIGWETISLVALVPSMAAKLEEFRMCGLSVRVGCGVRVTLKEEPDKSTRR